MWIPPEALGKLFKIEGEGEIQEYFPLEWAVTKIILGG
jgi:hypothetical protein